MDSQRFDCLGIETISVFRGEMLTCEDDDHTSILFPMPFVNEGRHRDSPCMFLSPPRPSAVSLSFTVTPMIVSFPWRANVN